MPTENELKEIARRVAFRITGVFEAKSYSTIQTVDSGIISYGQHQATLASGTLGTILKLFCDTSTSASATALKGFLSKVAAKDAALKTNQTFLDLLKTAGNEQEMKDAQDSIFIEKYWNPAVDKAVAEGVRSPLAFALFYDTKVQGGLDETIGKTRNKLGSNAVSEQKYLKTFLESRRERLLELAAVQINSTDPVKQKNGEMLKSSAKNRLDSLIALVDANNLHLTGKFNINGTLVNGQSEAPATPVNTGTAGGGTNAAINLKEGDVNEAVGVLQDKLIKLGFLTVEDVVPNRRTFGKKTLKALKKFQTDLGLAESGIFSANEQKLLDAIFNVVSREKPNEAITKKLQDKLVERGFMTKAEIGTAHGTFGQKTENAVKNFQIKKGLGQDGKLGPNTFKAIFN